MKTSCTMWSTVATGLTWNAGTSTIRMADVASIANLTFAGGGLTFNNFVWIDNQNTFALIFTGANTFADLRINPSGSARTFTLPAGATTTAATLELAGGSPGSKLTFNSSTPGVAATISVASGRVTGRNLIIQDITATGGAQFVAQNSTNVSGNTGWIFQRVGSLIRHGGRFIPL